MTPAISACKKNGVRNVLFTLWGDAGAECSRFSVLPALYYVAELCRGNEDIGRIKSDFKHKFGFDFDEFSLLDDPNRVALNQGVPFENSTTAKYMLYSDYFNGHYDFTVREGGGEYYRDLSKRLFEAKKKAGRYSYLFDTLAKLCVILSDKYELGVRTRAAYKTGDKQELLRLAKEEYTRIERAIPVFLSAFNRQWMKENKPYGFDVHEYRIGGLLARTKSCKRRLIDYAEGRVDSIPELECEILPFAHYKRGFSSYINSHLTTFTSNVVDE